MEKEYCIFIAKVIDDSVLEDIICIRDTAKELYNVDLKPSLKMNETNTLENKLNECGIPTNIKTSSANTTGNNTIEVLTKQLNDEVSEKSQNQLFIVSMEEYDKLIDNFYQAHNNLDLKLPKMEDMNILSIVQTCSIKTTEEYMRKHCVDIAQTLKNNIANKN